MAKFKVGDWVDLKVPAGVVNMRLIAHILEVTTQLCEAGIEQNTYTSRVWRIENEKIVPLPLQTCLLREMEFGEKIEAP